jgi:hypothetical protein
LARQDRAQGLRRPEAWERLERRQARRERMEQQAWERLCRQEAESSHGV